MEDVTEFSERCPTLEVAWIRYSASQKSKPGSLFLEIMSEREDDILVIHCSHITVSEVAS